MGRAWPGRGGPPRSGAAGRSGGRGWRAGGRRGAPGCRGAPDSGGRGRPDPRPGGVRRRSRGSQRPGSSLFGGQVTATSPRSPAGTSHVAPTEPADSCRRAPARRTNGWIDRRRPPESHPTPHQAGRCRRRSTSPRPPRQPRTSVGTATRTTTTAHHFSTCVLATRRVLPISLSGICLPDSTVDIIKPPASGPYRPTSDSRHRQARARPADDAVPPNPPAGPGTPFAEPRRRTPVADPGRLVVAAVDGRTTWDRPVAAITRSEYHQT
ncbi:PE-PGRS family protein [Parafrankia sp. EUN1f]|nr:PE-PGRS family protein [Parafrankia sp. EUN1f]